MGRFKSGRKFLILSATNSGYRLNSLHCCWSRDQFHFNLNRGSNGYAIVDKQLHVNVAVANNVMKKVVGVEKVRVPAGEFDCVKIQWLFEGEQSQKLQFFEFISSVGLVLIAKDSTAPTTSNSEPLGLFDAQDEMVRTSFNLR